MELRKSILLTLSQSNLSIYKCLVYILKKKQQFNPNYSKTAGMLQKRALFLIFAIHISTLIN